VAWSRAAVRREKGWAGEDEGAGEGAGGVQCRKSRGQRRLLAEQVAKATVGGQGGR
jgi:hypothetical protein